MNTHASGRPVRFFVLLMGGWAIIRLTTAGMFGSNDDPAPKSVALAHRTAPATPIRPTAAAIASYHVNPPVPSRGAARRLVAPASMVSPIGSPRIASTFAPGATTQPALPLQNAADAPPPRPFGTSAAPSAILLPPSGQTHPDRWRGGAWLLWRAGGATPANAVSAGRLGGSQMGLRIDYDLAPHAPGRTASYGRVSTAMNRPGAPEAAIGLSWQPMRSLPISIAVERRISLGASGRNANALLAVGGFGPTPVVADIEAEAYAQSGMVGFRRRDLFADGKFSLMKPLAHSPLRIGASISGGAQPDVERLDIGPELQIRLPLPHIATRLGIEWRERIAGRATPASGVAVTLGADF